MGYLEVIKGLAGGPPTHYYPLNDNYRMQDVIGGLNGQNVGNVTWTTDAKSAAKFTGSNYIEIADHDHFSVGGTRNNGTMSIVSFLTVDAWAKPSGVPSSIPRVYWMGKYRSNGELEWTGAKYWQPDAAEGRARRISIYHNNLTSVGAGGVGDYFSPRKSSIPAGVDTSTFYFGPNPATPENFENVPEAMNYVDSNAGTEMMVVCRFQAPDKPGGFFIDIFLNGVRKGHQIKNQAPDPANLPLTFKGQAGGPGPSPVRFGKSADSGTWGLTGRLRRIAFFDHVLSQADINTIYASRALIETDGTPPPPPPPPPPPVETGTITIASMGISSTFVVDALNGSGFVPPPEPVITAPAAPSLTALAGDSRIDYVWQPNGDGGSPITGYTMTVTSSVATEAPQTFNFGATATAFSLTSVTNGRTYTATLTANNAIGSSAVATSIAVPATAARAPGPITALATVALNHAAKVTFATPTDQGSSAVTGYRITASSPLSTLTYTTTSTSPTLNGLTNGLNYSITVVAISPAGTSTPNTTFVVPSATPAGQIAPDPVTQLTLTPYTGVVLANWTAPTFFGSQAFSDYLVVATSSANQTYYYSISGTSAYLGGFAPNSSVIITVYTRTGGGDSPGVSANTGLADAPAAPTGVTLQAPYTSEPLTPTPSTNSIFPDGYVAPAKLPVASTAPTPPKVYTAAPKNFITAFPQGSVFHPANFGQLTPIITVTGEDA